MKEKWNSITNFPNYEASSLGRIRSTDRVVPNNSPSGRSGTRKLIGQVLKMPIGTHGYPCVNINHVSRLVHRLIAESFIDNPLRLRYVDHKNGNKSDNRVENLRWCSMKQNGMNSKKRLDSNTKYRGVSFSRNTNKWRVRIGKIQYGQFKSIEEAHSLWLEKMGELYPDFMRVDNSN